MVYMVYVWMVVLMRYIVPKIRPDGSRRGSKKRSRGFQQRGPDGVGMRFERWVLIASRRGSKESP